MDVETTSSGRRRVRPLKYNDFASTKQKSASSEATNKLGVEIETESVDGVKGIKRRRSDKRLKNTEIPAGRIESESKRTRSIPGAAKANESIEIAEMRGSKRKRSNIDSVESIPKEEGLKRSRLNRNSDSQQAPVSTPIRSTRGKSLASTDALEAPGPSEIVSKRRKVLNAPSDDEDLFEGHVELKHEDIDSAVTPDYNVERRGRKITKELKIPLTPAKLEEPVAADAVVHNKRGRRPNAVVNAVLAATSVESDTQSEAADISQSPSARSLRLANRAPPKSERRQLRTTNSQDNVLDSSYAAMSTELSGDESFKPKTKIDRRTLRRGKHLKKAVESSRIAEQSIENQSDEETTVKVLSRSNMRKEKVILADIFLKNNNGSREPGKRKRLSNANKPAARISSRIAAATVAAASPTSMGGGSGDEQPPTTKKQMTLPEMLPFKQKRDAALAAAKAAATTATASKETRRSSDKSIESMNSKDIATNVSAEMVGMRPITATPKLRGKRNVTQADEKPIDEYSAEADDEMEEEVKLCNKKKLIQNMSNVVVALKDINVDYKLTEGASVKTNAPGLESALAAANIDASKTEKDTTSASISEIVPKPKLEVSVSLKDLAKSDVEKFVGEQKDRNDKSMSERQMLAVAKKTKKPQKIPEDDHTSNDVVASSEENKLPRRSSSSILVYKSDDGLAPNEGSSTSIAPALVPTTDLDDTNKLQPNVDTPKKDETKERKHSRKSSPVVEKEVDSVSDTLAESAEMVQASMEKCSVITEGRRSKSIDGISQLPEKATEDQTSVIADGPKSNEEEKESEEVMQSESSDNATSVLKINENYKIHIGGVPEDTPEIVPEEKGANVDVRPNVIIDKAPDTTEISNRPADSISDDTSVSNLNTSENISGASIDEIKTTTEIVSNDKVPPKTKNDVYRVSDSESETEIDGEKIKTLKNPPDELVKSVNKEQLQIAQSQPNESSLTDAADSSPDSKKTVIKSIREPDTVVVETKPSIELVSEEPPKTDTSKPTNTSNIETVKPVTKPAKLDGHNTIQMEADASGDVNHTTPSPEKSSVKAPPTGTITKVETSVPKNDQKADPFPVNPRPEMVQPQMQQQPQQIPQPQPLPQPQQQPRSCDRSQDVRRANKERVTQHSETARIQAIQPKSQTDPKRSTAGSCSQTTAADSKRDSKNDNRMVTPSGANELSKKIESPAKKEGNRMTSSGSASSSSTKNLSNDLHMGSSKSSMMGSGSMPGSNRSDKHHSKNIQEQKSSASATVDMNKMPPQFTMNQLPNYPQYWQWDPYNPYPGYSLPHLDPTATQKSPNKFHKDLANTMYGHGLAPNLYQTANLAANTQQSQYQQSQQFQQQQLQNQHIQQQHHSQQLQQHQQLQQQQAAAAAQQHHSQSNNHRSEKSSSHQRVDRKSSSHEQKHHSKSSKEDPMANKAKDAMYGTNTSNKSYVQQQHQYEAMKSVQSHKQHQKSSGQQQKASSHANMQNSINNVSAAVSGHLTPHQQPPMSNTMMGNSVTAAAIATQNMMGGQDLTGNTTPNNTTDLKQHTSPAADIPSMGVYTPDSTTNSVHSLHHYGQCDLDVAQLGLESPASIASDIASQNSVENVRPPSVVSHSQIQFSDCSMQQTQQVQSSQQTQMHMAIQQQHSAMSIPTSSPQHQQQAMIMGGGGGGNGNNINNTHQSQNPSRKMAQQHMQVPNAQQQVRASNNSNRATTPKARGGASTPCLPHQQQQQQRNQREVRTNYITFVNVYD